MSRVAAIGGAALGSVAAFPAFDAMRQALPMVQAELLMAVVVVLPLILAFSAYEIKTDITLAFVVFTLKFLMFWRELAADGALQLGHAQQLQYGCLLEQLR